MEIFAISFLILSLITGFLILILKGNEQDKNTQKMSEFYHLKGRRGIYPFQGKLAGHYWTELLTGERNYTPERSVTITFEVVEVGRAGELSKIRLGSGSGEREDLIKRARELTPEWIHSSYIIWADEELIDLPEEDYELEN